MKMPNKEEQRQLVRQWKETGRILEELRCEKLRGKPYDWREVDMILQLGDFGTPRPDNGRGMVEMQRKFMQIHRAQLQRRSPAGEQQDRDGDPDERADHGDQPQE